MTPVVEKVAPDLYLVPLPVALPGFRGFITAWVYTAGPVVLVDVGPSSTTGHLLEALAQLGVRQPDLILLTHIHIDHAGGIGEVARAFPKTAVVCHPKAVTHLVDPARLWEGSLKTLGDVARQYGPIIPVDASRIVAADVLDLPAIQAVPTPGHAAHQYSYLIGDLLFAGEAGGVCITIDDSTEYLRPATPPPFRLETCLESIERLVALRPDRICYGHIGMRGDAVARLESHHDQLQRWYRWIVEGFGAGRTEDNPHALDAWVDDLRVRDPLLAGWAQMDSESRERERFFLRNSVKGYLDYLKSK